MSEKQNVTSYVITKAPSLADVMRAERQHGSITMPTAYFSAPQEDDTSVATCTLGVLTLSNVRNVNLSTQDRELSFEGDRQYSWEHESYNRVSTRTETTVYRVVVRWRYGLDSDALAYLLQV